MIQLRILSGKMAGAEHVARHFPFRIGRSAAADLRMEEDGVWDDHVELGFDHGIGFVFSARPDAITAVNGQPCSGAVLRNGDELELGAVKIRFWLAPTKQRSQAVRAWLVWAALVLVTGVQFLLIYRLLP